MKLFFILLLSYCIVNTHALDQVDEHVSPITEAIIEIISKMVARGELLIPDWDSKASIEINTINLADKSLEAGYILGWNPDKDIEDNLVNVAEAYFKLIPIEGLNVTKSVKDNVIILVDGIFKLYPFSALRHKPELKQSIVDRILNALTLIPEIDINQSVHNDITSWIESAIAKVQIIDPSAPAEKTVNYLIDTLFDEIKLPGFSSDKTLHDNVADILRSILSNSADL
ncbi:uncharacterized protein LOC107370925 isoform X2 [Tetranychus urticae]|uniref:uncharacterized protein LOC107370925 isoform X2 n=1 Tax=Tetranychus urticae TaxID=32264 RepID=UPI00077BF1F6|nr:uncharacterized protein LOC107370925 isoform X2 [Tetranychus urticae]